MKTKSNKIIYGVLIVVLLLVVVLKKFNIQNNSYVNAQTSTQTNPDSKFTKQDIPQNAIDVLNYVRKYHQPMSGYEGGRVFKNREKRLPIYDEKQHKIYYQEWDIYPKIKGKNRGAERLITGSNQTAYYTNDHYNTFVLIQE